jgi:hypothetical protein
MTEPEHHPDALEVLIEQHDQIDQIIAQLEDQEISEERKALVFQTLADNVAAHAWMEEQLFYPAVRARRIAGVADDQHTAIKRVLTDMLQLELDDPQFATQLAQLKEEFRRHARDDEERDLFPTLRRMMTPVELAALGIEMLALFERLITQEPWLRVPSQERPLAP